MTTSSVRALARVARRDIARHRARSVLVTLLVLLPVAAMVAGTAIFRTTQPTQEASDTARMGRADLVAIGTSREDLEGFLPGGSVVEVMSYSEGRIVVPGARPTVQLNGMDLDGLAAGMRTLVAGRLPTGTAEVAVSEAIVDLAAVSIDGQLTFDDGRSATVVGIVENPMYLGDRFVVVDPRAWPLGPEESATWLVDLPEGVDAQEVVDATFDPDTGEQGVLLQSRESGRISVSGGDATSGTILILGALALVEAALIASAAFAVSIRRRQRELGLLAATGATPRQLAGTVVAEALILGALACAGGVLVGLLGAFALTPWLDELTQRRNQPLVVDLAGLVGPVVIGFLAALIAAVVPARTVARVPVLLALSGRRPPEARARRTLWVGIAAVVSAALMTVVGATMRDAGSGTASIGLLVGGAVLSTLGFGACSPWLLERLEGFAARLPLAGRIAFRDTARARSRSSPIVTAILAGLAAAIAIGAWTTSRDAENLAGWRPALHPDQLALIGPGAEAAAAELLGAGEVVAVAESINLFPGESAHGILFTLPDARHADGKVINLLEQCGNCNPGVFEPYQVQQVAAATPELLAMTHAQSAAEDLRQGYAVLLAYEQLTAETMAIEIYGGFEGSELLQTVNVPVRVIVTGVGGGILPEAFLPEATIQELGLVPGGEADDWPFVVQYDHPVADADLTRARDVAARFPETFASVFSAPERPGEGFRLVIVGLVLLFAVSVTGIAIALGEAESRPEQRSLLALGADPRLRRRIAAARAAVLALLAGVLAVPAGLLPIWGIFASRGSPLALPTLEIVGAVLALPVLAVASSWLLSRPLPDWSAFRSVGSGQ